IVLTFRLDFASLARTKTCLAQLSNKEGIALDKIRLVAGRSGQPKELPLASAEKVLGVNVSQSIPFDPANALAAINIGAPVVTELPTSNISRSITSLAGLISDTHTAQANPKVLLS